MRYQGSAVANEEYIERGYALPQERPSFEVVSGGGLDARARREIWQLLASLRDQGLTILLTSHFMDEVEALCDEICILRRGNAVFTGTVEEAKAHCGCTDFEDAYLMLSEDEKGENA